MPVFSRMGLSSTLLQATSEAPDPPSGFRAAPYNGDGPTIAQPWCWSISANSLSLISANLRCVRCCSSNNPPALPEYRETDVFSGGKYSFEAIAFSGRIQLSRKIAFYCEFGSRGRPADPVAQGLPHMTSSRSRPFSHGNSSVSKVTHALPPGTRHPRNVGPPEHPIGAERVKAVVQVLMEAAERIRVLRVAGPRDSRGRP